ncbi:hypothetical protein Tco_0271670 [Tanacetum coccineum]
MRNEPSKTYPYEEVDPLNPSPPASEFEPDNEIEVENLIKHEDKTIPVSVYEVGESSTATIPREDARSSVEQGTAAMEKLVEKLKNVKEKDEWKKLKKELKEARLCNTFLRMQNEQVERDLYEPKSIELMKFYQDIFVGDMCLKKDRMKLLMQVNVRNDASGSGPVRGRDTVPAIRECTFAGFMKCNPAAFHGVEGAAELRRWFEKTESVFEISECAEDKKVKFIVATLEGLALT